MNDFENIKTPEELLSFMDCITYGFVGKNGRRYTNPDSEEWNDWFNECYVQSGEDVLESKIGTCWDQVELERLWFEKNNYNFKTFFIWFELNRNNDLPTHTFLIYEKDDKYYWFEHAFETQKGIHKFNILEEAIEDAKSKQMQYTKMNHKDACDEDLNCLNVYEYSKPKDHLNVDEYLNHVTNIPYNKNLGYKF